MFHILNPFPDLLTYSLLAPVILRLTLGYFFFRVAISRFQTISESGTVLAAPIGWKILAVAEIIIALCFIAGFGVQIVSLISIVLLIIGLIFYQSTYFLRHYSREVLFLLLLISLSLLLSGAGAWAIDLPL
ncbi:MAG TPA: hypothetical protein VFA52_03255 [Candidatus Paceibacterota bacterium]|nr:hypothetical protein [Candidatus Paceibacterota bacterium]